MAKNNNDWKDRLNVVYSTNPDFSEKQKNRRLKLRKNNR